MKPRGYQQDVIDGALSAWRDHRRIAGVMPTGAGKTVVFSHVAKLARAAGPVLVIAHRRELTAQAIDKLQQVNPGVTVGLFEGPVKQWRADMVVSSVQTASTERGLAMLAARRWSLIIVDECHHVSAASYQKVLRRLRAFEADGPLTLGMTATLDRADGLSLGETFETIIKPRLGLVDLIRHPDGPYLVPPRGIRVKIAGLDLAHVRRTAGDFNAHALGAAMTAAMAPQKIVEAWAEHAKGRLTMAFAPTVEFSIELAAAFTDAGHTMTHLDGTTPADVRLATIDRARRGETHLSNVGLFTEGTDLPPLECVILARPTSSSTLYQQMVGRGLRLHPGKRDCIILDVSGVTGRHKLATLATLDGAASPEDVPDELLMYEEDLSELVDDEQDDEQHGGQETLEYETGDLEHEMIDLFGQSHSAWLRTDGGVWFLPTPHGWVYLHPREHDRYDLAYFAVNGTGGVIQASMEIGYAMAAGDEYVAAVPMWQLDRSAEWRNKKINGSTTRGQQYDRRQREAATTALDKLLGIS